MKYIFSLFLILLLFGCGDLFRPHDINFKKGDNWIDSLYNLSEFRDIQHFVLKDNKLYCNTIRFGYPCSFYCLNLTTGKVDWVNQIKAYCAFESIALDDVIYCTTYVNNIYAYDLNGNLMWENEGSFGSTPPSFNALNHNLIYGNCEYDKLTGKVVNRLGSYISPVFYEENIVVAKSILTKGDKGENLICSNYKTKKKVWGRKLFAERHNLTLEGNSIYCVDSIMNLHKIDCENGKDIWVFNLEQSQSNEQKLFLGETMVDSNKIFFSTNLQNDTCLMLDAQTGKIEGMMNLIDIQKLGYLKPMVSIVRINLVDKSYELTIKNRGKFFTASGLDVEIRKL
jgi:outer membrane protein assembly factor BamB